MSFSEKEKKVINLLRELIVATMQALCSKLNTSRSTVLRALKTYGYLSSCNFNSSYFTLKDIPQFDKDGLWFHGQVCFSTHGTLKQTIKALVEHSANGYTVSDLEKRLGTQVHNQLSWLCQRKMLDRFYLGRHCVYTSVEPETQASQEAQRKLQIKKATTTQQLPQRLDPLTVIRLLVEMLQSPDAKAASLSQRLKGQGVCITTEQVQRVVEFYSLQKKTEQ